MQIDPEDFKRHYALLSDEALLEINTDELVDAARPYYDAELADRKLVPLAEEDAPLNISDETPGQMEDGLQEVATFISLEEANFARGLLQSADIPCSFENEQGAAWTGTGELRLMVPAADYDRACEALESEISDEELAAQAEAEATESPETSENDERQ